MAKSAATMIIFGSNKIYMSKTSELGPIDPQVTILEGEQVKRLSVHSIIQSYETLIKKATNAKGRIEPYLQQLSRYDAKEIEEYKRAMELSESIAVKNLKVGMLLGKNEKEIKNIIKPFLSPLETKSHGRPIFIEQAQKIGLAVEEIDIKSEIWKVIWELYLRSDFVLSRSNSKLVESKSHHYYVGVPYEKEK